MSRTKTTSSPDTTGKAAGQAAAFPADIAKAVQELASDPDTLHGRLKHDVGPLLRALENLTDCHRVLSGIESAANRDKSLDERIAASVEGWRGPMLEDPLDLVGDLARVALSSFVDRQVEADELVTRAYGVSNLVRGRAAA